MELLFKEETFSEEFQSLIGNVDGDIKFRTLKSDLVSSTKEMIKLIGAPMYESALAAYKKIPLPVDEDEIPEDPPIDPPEGITEEEKELLYHVQYPLALNAFRLFLPVSDLEHTPNGRVMRSDDHEKSPWEWMIERDNRAQERKYYRSVDDLLAYLDEENPVCTIAGEEKKWRDSEAYKKQKEYFVNSTDDFDEYFPINSRLLLVRMLPGIRKAERSHILPIIGKEKFEALKTAHQDGDVPEEDETLYERMKEACVYFALAWSMKRLTANLFPEGMLQQFEISSLINMQKKPERLETQLAFQEFSKDAESLFREIEALVAPAPEPTDETDDGPLPHDFGFDENDKFATA